MRPILMTLAMLLTSSLVQAQRAGRGVRLYECATTGESTRESPSASVAMTAKRGDGQEIIISATIKLMANESFYTTPVILQEAGVLKTKVQFIRNGSPETFKLEIGEPSGRITPAVFTGEILSKRVKMRLVCTSYVETIALD